MSWFIRRTPSKRRAPAGGWRGIIPTAPQSIIVEGRRYYDDQQVPYALPKDMTDVNRLDFQHYLYRLTLKGNYLAPLDAKRVHNMLDVGCGTSRWGIEMAEAFPQAQIIGLDLEDLHQQGTLSAFSIVSNQPILLNHVATRCSQR